MLSLIIPTFNEALNIERLLGNFHGSADIVIVDDASKDGTAEVAGKFGTVIHRPNKMGIGSAILKGLERSYCRGNSIFVQMDADLSHRLSFIPKLIKPILAGDADVTIASRYIPGGHVVGWSWKRRQISKWANNMARAKFDLPIRDCTSGFKAYNRKACQKLIDSDIKAKGFEFQVLSLHMLHELGYQILEIPYIFLNRTHGKSKLKLIDVLRFMRILF